jgi:hypothetical protein
MNKLKEALAITIMMPLLIIGYICVVCAITINGIFIKAPLATTNAWNKAWTDYLQKEKDEKSHEKEN